MRAGSSADTMLAKAANAGRHAHVARGADLYETPPEAVRALLAVERIPHTVSEPAAGRGAIGRVLRDAGHVAITSDLIDHGFPLHFARDFFTVTSVPVGTEVVVTNAPLSMRRRIHHARAEALSTGRCPVAPRVPGVGASLSAARRRRSGPGARVQEQDSLHASRFLDGTSRVVSDPVCLVRFQSRSRRTNNNRQDQMERTMTLRHELKRALASYAAEGHTAEGATRTIFEGVIAVLRRRFPYIDRAEFDLLLAEVRIHTEDLLDALVTSTVALDAAVEVTMAEFFAEDGERDA